MTKRRQTGNRATLDQVGEDCPWDLDEPDEVDRQALAALERERGDRTMEEYARILPRAAATQRDLRAKFGLTD